MEIKGEYLPPTYPNGKADYIFTLTLSSGEIDMLRLGYKSISGMQQFLQLHGCSGDTEALNVVYDMIDKISEVANAAV